jgi:transcription-repair coupling factor (superfamily II helicase)
LPLPQATERWRRWPQPHGAALALALGELAAERTQPLLVLTGDTRSAQLLQSDLQVMAPSGLEVVLIPDWETLPYDHFQPHPEIVAERIAALIELPRRSSCIVIAPVAVALQRLAPRSYLLGRSLWLKVGDRLDLERQRRLLEEAGYRTATQVLEPGDVAVRGGLLDLFPIGADTPYRIELFDDEVESIRPFDVESQRSMGSVKEVRLLPAREFPFDEESLKPVRDRIRDRFDIDLRRSGFYQDLKNGVAPAGIEYYLPLFFEQTETLYDYLPEGSLLAVVGDVWAAASDFLTEAGERYEQRAHDIDRPVLPLNELYLGVEEARARVNGFERILIGSEGVSPTEAAPDLPLFSRQTEPGQALRDFIAGHPGALLIAADSPGRREALLETLARHQLRAAMIDDWQTFERERPALAVTSAALSDGFQLPAAGITVLTERQLYGERAAQSRRRSESGRDPASIIRDLGELSEGSPVVHEDHGVGRYIGLVTLELGGTEGEFLAIEYAGHDKLYVPVAQLALVSRYTGGAPEHAPLHALGGEAWEKAKKRAAEKIHDVAAELLEIQARRAARKGEAIELDRAMYEQFAAAFPFEETPDQQSAIDAVISDLAKATPMDRVVCGDVGFGKTEVALRAAFCAVQAGKQVAVLVPTTLLATQHHRNFSDRLADWPIRVEVLSRFVSGKDAKTALERIETGQVDVVIGTHRLLQKDIRFKDLGLVIVDEEQRFGVRQKEALKKLRAEVHLLTLTATPIPRTLNMALGGLRELSIIATPPAHRLAVKTLIAPRDNAVVREAIQRELARGGQVYFLHNEVQSIERAARELSELVPQARVGIAHGQMAERQLEQVMLDFYRQRCNVLVCSTIVENGIDVPTANTILIERADKFGLSQLHQLRGRVGRSHHRAYAYLLVPDRKAMTGDAVKRLDALASLDELGAGFTLATHDLEIRGAGELLGEEQSGQIEAIGFALYSDYLERAVNALKSGKIPDVLAERQGGAEIELQLPALIPEDYLGDVHARLTLYKRIANCRSEDELDALKVEMIDRFGLLPQPCKNLYACARLKLQAERLGVRKLNLGPLGGRLGFVEKPAVEPLSVIKLVQRESTRYAFDGPDKLRIRVNLEDPVERLRFAEELLQKLETRHAA